VAHVAEHLVVLEQDLPALAALFVEQGEGGVEAAFQREAAAHDARAIHELELAGAHRVGGGPRRGSGQPEEQRGEREAGEGALAAQSTLDGGETEREVGVHAAILRGRTSRGVATQRAPKSTLRAGRSTSRSRCSCLPTNRRSRSEERRVGTT